MRLAALCLLLAACEPLAPLPDTTPPTPEDAIPGACGAACERLRSPAVACPEGFGSVGGASCETTCVRATALRPLPLACWAAATNQASAKACGALRCVK